MQLVLRSLFQILSAQHLRQVPRISLRRPGLPFSSPSPCAHPRQHPTTGSVQEKDAICWSNPHTRFLALIIAGRGESAKDRVAFEKIGGAGRIRTDELMVLQTLITSPME